MNLASWIAVAAAAGFALGSLIDQIVSIREVIVLDRIADRASRSNGVFRAIVEGTNDLAHPLAGLCIEIEHRYNRLGREAFPMDRRETPFAKISGRPHLPVLSNDHLRHQDL